MIKSVSSSDSKTRRGVRVTAWIVGIVAATIYLGSILQIVLRR